MIKTTKDIGSQYYYHMKANGDVYASEEEINMYQYNFILNNFPSFRSLFAAAEQIN